MKKTVITIIATLGLGSALMASGHGMHACKHHKDRSGISQTIQQLDLTEAQKKELQAIREAQRAERKASRKAMKEKRTGKQQRMDLGKFMSAEKFDKEAFKTAMKERMQQREEMREKRREAMIEKRAERMEKFFSILTPEQREKWIQLSQK
ncbi:periplasmic heavy metal sensor [Sulfurovum sp.]|jgi:Spy/CpxP family protein refolding chaperone|uniref:Spy/CpxP family protein refolding chaperone n=1 Tax=Sulfurovum sp. TaxID=1969726 RepID=UPI002A35ABC7|nr:periplasmic heavy metal sensor [Sulfurovum sp.]MDD2451524.1 periplasmic heavy metal sensor [Sulfurovum sp.]MDD3500145.1 periplasmic heavy metal sensor [Sulfurovum sp.]MDY0402628.1 periplasmic heavy metal sensor [Sulfurovum sp.]